MDNFKHFFDILKQKKCFSKKYFILPLKKLFSNAELFYNSRLVIIEINLSENKPILNFFL